MTKCKHKMHYLVPKSAHVNNATGSVARNELYRNLVDNYRRKHDFRNTKPCAW